MVEVTVDDILHEVAEFLLYEKFLNLLLFVHCFRCLFYFRRPSA